MNKIKEEIISMLIEHSRIIYSVLSDMGVFYNRWAEDYEKNKSSLEKKKNKMQLSEEDADAIKIQLIQNFSESGAGLGTFVALILKMDNVINYPLDLYQIGVRDNHTYKEESCYLPIKKPKEFKFTSLEETITFAKTLSSQEEG